MAWGFGLDQDLWGADFSKIGPQLLLNFRSSKPLTAVAEPMTASTNLKANNERTFSNKN